jgi:hypothetical protein
MTSKGNKVKVMLSLCLIKYQKMEMYREVNVCGWEAEWDPQPV